MDVVKGLIGLAIILAIYLLPSWIASDRKTKNQNGILVLNILTGWTGIGWLVCLIMACGSNPGDDEAEIEHLKQSDQEVIHPLDAIERLAAMKEKGLFTDEEFQQQKTKILSS